MYLNTEDNRLTFIVDTLCSIGFEYKGGSFAVHRLAYEIACRGHNVFVFNDPFYPHENIRKINTIKEDHDGGWWATFVWDQFGYNPSKTISIYTQITWGNPFNTWHNVRWILHDYEQEKWETYSENDLICNYESFKVPEGTKQTKLTVFDYNFDKFYNTKNPDRKGFGHLIHKFTPEWGHEFIKNFGSEEIPHYNGKNNLDYLLEKFNKYEYLLMFDKKSYYTVAAALCGTKVILLDTDKNITPYEYRKENPIQMCGVAYGFDDISWAENTINYTKNHLMQLEKLDRKTVDNFIKYWEEKLL